MMMNCPIHKKWLEALAKSVAKHHQWRGDFCSCGYQYRIAGPKVINKDHKKSFKKQGHLVFDNILAGVGHFPDGGITFTSCTGTQFPQDSLQILVGCGVVCCLLEDQTIDKELMKPWYEALYDKMISELKLLPVPHPSTTKMTFVGASLAACSKVALLPSTTQQGRSFGSETPLFSSGFMEDQVTDYQVTPNDQQQLVHITKTNVKTKRPLSSPSRKCSICKETGHTKKTCPKKPRTETLVDLWQHSQFDQ
eukprot:TRINITY_DN381_c0_g1_i11.p1 TRINITY_DN381_c0_g1~~TRINITY_DN381_c0_g1_i11.p1  ORF type:complete len:251 (-),score=40.66 TRINITY_DN381_c0_g1_i11:209-961(-)